ncbi:hypothetical protein [Pseudomonas sp. NFACC08-1]|uniref:hypothetical protein n=1 Tax=Pseudomonas sp. NFACC08-1 TaxID=1566238 RepID=UPI00089A063B|nr:hypothetical protein [Pseudomonas sp. NFACC08-1]SDX26716.1 Scavenger mRNA decapping enzyme C-term binding [Pseudomonas sp. NFACC08-1]
MTQIQASQRSTATIPTEQSHQRNQALTVKAVHNTQESPMRRTLDAYGIDDTRGAFSQLNREKYHVFVKKDSAGTPDLTHGAYVSKQDEDGYGNFNWLNPKGLIKYQTQDVAVITFTNKDQLTQLSDTYLKRPLPVFLTKILNAEACLDTDLYRRNASLAEFISPIDLTQHGYLIGPNSPYCDATVLDTYVNAPETLKNSKDGIILCTYAIHPGIQSEFLAARHHPSGPERLETSQQTPQSTIGDKTKLEPLTSILSLKQEHIPQLEKLRGETFKHLREVYAVGEHDNVRMFFHFPVAEKTATLHLHTWVNKGDHPLNEPRSFDLDTIIAHLESGKDIGDFVLSRNEGSYFLPTSDTIKDISGIPFKGLRDNVLNLPL